MRLHKGKQLVLQRAELVRRAIATLYGTVKANISHSPMTISERATESTDRGLARQLCYACNEVFHQTVNLGLESAHFHPSKVDILSVSLAGMDFKQ